MRLGETIRPLLLFAQLCLDVGAALARATVAWHDFAWIRRLWPGPLVIKGVLTGDDARRVRHLDRVPCVVVVASAAPKTVTGVRNRWAPEPATALGPRPPRLDRAGHRPRTHLE